MKRSSTIASPATPIAKESETRPDESDRSRLGPTSSQPAPKMSGWVWALGIGGIVVFGVMASSIYRHFWGAPADDNTYRVGTVARHDVFLTVSATGTIQPWTTVDIKSKAGGLVEQLLVQLGDRVKKDQVIARIDPTDSLLVYNQSVANQNSARAKQDQSSVLYKLQTAQTPLTVEQARAQLESAQANLDASQAALAAAIDTSDAQPAVTNATILQAQSSYDSAQQDLLQLDATQPSDLAAARASLDQSVATAENARANEQRTRELYAQGFVAAQDLDTAATSLTVAQAAADAAKAKFATFVAGQIAAKKSQIGRVQLAKAALQAAKAQAVDITLKKDAVEQAKANFELTRSQVANAKFAYRLAVANTANDRVKQLDVASAYAATAFANAAVSNAKITLDQTVVRAPSVGVVLLKYVDEGAMITSGISLNSSGTAIVQIGDVSRKYIDVQVDETDIANIRMNQTVDVTADAFPGSPIKGHVILINPAAQVDQNVTTIHVRVEIDPTDKMFPRLKPYMNATCDFRVENRPSVISVPVDAIHDENGKSYVQIASGGRSVASKVKSTGDTKDFMGVDLTRKYVKVGLRGNAWIEIKSGLKEGDTIVVQTIIAAKSPTATSSPMGSSMGRGFGGR